MVDTEIIDTKADCQSAGEETWVVRGWQGDKFLGYLLFQRKGMGIRREYLATIHESAAEASLFSSKEESFYFLRRAFSCLYFADKHFDVAEYMGTRE